MVAATAVAQVPTPQPMADVVAMVITITPIILAGAGVAIMVHVAVVARTAVTILVAFPPLAAEDTVPTGEVRWRVAVAER